MAELKKVADLFAGTGGLALLFGLWVLLLVAAVLFHPGREPYRRLLALIRAWRGNRR